MITTDLTCSLSSISFSELYLWAGVIFDKITRIKYVVYLYLQSNIKY